jgi:hypothetical protein
MKKKFLAIIGAIGLAFAGVAVAQVQIPYVTSLSVSDATQVIPRGAPSAGNVYATMAQLRAWLFSSNSQMSSAAPVLTSCGGGTPTIVGNNFAGTVTTGTSATACTITFTAGTYSATPACVVVSQTAPGTSTPAYTVSSTAITLAQASGSGIIWNYVCVGQAGT